MSFAYDPSVFFLAFIRLALFLLQIFDHTPFKGQRRTGFPLIEINLKVGCSPKSENLLSHFYGQPKNSTDFIEEKIETS